jgi:hypothetical protein
MALIAMLAPPNASVVSGTTPTPTLRSTMRQTASKLRSWMRSRRGLPAGSPCRRGSAGWRWRGRGPRNRGPAPPRNDLRAGGQRVVRPHHQHEPVAAEREGHQPPGVDGASHDADVADAFGDQADDLVAQPLLQIDR